MKAKIRKIDGIFPVTVDSAVYVAGTKKKLNEVIAELNDKFGGGKFKFLTQAEYDALEKAGQLDPEVEYHITDAEQVSDIEFEDLTQDESMEIEP